MHSLQHEIAIAAAQMIAEEGLDYLTAKRKAFSRLTGGHGDRIAQAQLPTNEQVEEAVRTHLALFCADHQPARLLHLRQTALDLMKRLSAFDPVLLGAVANGTATEFSVIHIVCVCDSAKALGIALIDDGMAPEAVRLSHPAGREEIEGLSFVWRGESVLISVIDRPGLPKRLGAMSLSQLQSLLVEAPSK